MKVFTLLLILVHPLLLLFLFLLLHRFLPPSPAPREAVHAIRPIFSITWPPPTQDS